jgi:hypothetical protein
MSELTSDVLVSLSTPDEVARRLGVLKVTGGAPSTNRFETVCDRLDGMHDLDGGLGIRSAMLTGLTGTGSVGDGRRVGARASTDPGPVQTLDIPVSAALSGNGALTVDAAESRVASRRQWTRRVAPIGPGNLGSASQDDGPSGERWGAPPVVAATKLMIPRSRRPLVSRPRVSARLDEDYRLALVSAPAGYGKTAALATWAAGHRDRVAWLSCDPCDADPTRRRVPSAGP